MSPIRLGVNIDHAVTLRQVRGATTQYPDLLQIIEEIKLAGADQITIHLREDRRHIQDCDVVLLCQKSTLPINLEMAVSEEMLQIALLNKPKWVCLVPEKREELTTEGGLDVDKFMDRIGPFVEKLSSNGILVSMFIEPDEKQIIASYKVKADAVEFHTGAWVLAQDVEKEIIWKKLVKSCEYANSLNLKVHVGHGLDYSHTKIIKQLPFLREANIGHSIICYSIAEGIKTVTQKMLKYLNG